MARQGKFFELLDVVKFAVPNALTLDASATSYNLAERVAGGGFMSYGALWPRLDVLVRGLATDDYIDTALSFYEDDWKNKSRASRDSGSTTARPTPCSSMQNQKPRT
jgi:hypothetical protein